MKATTEPTAACEVISRKELELTFADIIRQLERPLPKGKPCLPFSDYESSEEDLKETVKKFFSEHDGREECYVTPKQRIDVILQNDSRASPNELVATFLHALDQQE